MTNIIRVVLVMFLCLSTVSLKAENLAELGGRNATVEAQQYDWSKVMDAIIYVESRGNVMAVSGKSVGPMQITPVLVAECNNILKSRKINKRYTLKDRYDLEKSKEMFLLIQSHANPRNNVEQAIRSWNGGYKYSVKRTQKYYERVMRRLQAIQ